MNTKGITQTLISRQQFFGERERFLSLRRVVQATAGEIARATALAPDFLENHFEELVHIFSGRGVLGEEQVATFSGGQESDRFFGLRNLGGEEAEIFSWDAFEDPRSDAKA